MTAITPTHTFDGERFSVISNSRELDVVVSRKRGRWQYRTSTGVLLASGLTPAQFVQQFWFGTLEEN